jgi:hypothetical protein
MKQNVWNDQRKTLATKKKNARGSQTVEDESVMHNIAMLSERSAFERPGQVGFLQPEVEQTLVGVNETRIGGLTKGHAPERRID